MYILTKFYFCLMVLVFGLTLSNAQPTDNVLAYFPFNGNANDVTGNGFNGTIRNATLTTDRLGKANAAYYFNASNAVITLPNLLLPSNAAFSFGCWFRTIGNTAAGTIPGQGIIDLRGQYQVSLGYNQPNHASNPNSVSFYMYSDPTTVYITSPNNTVMPNTWYHLMCNYGNNVMELYINGVLIGAQPMTPPGAVNGYNITIGKDYDLSRNRAWVNGNIDEVIFYKRKLTAAEILVLYQKECTTSELPELYGPISFDYDLAGNRTSRHLKVVATKSSFVQKDSIILESNKPSLLNPVDSLQTDDLSNKIVIFPNPTKGILQVDFRDIKFSHNDAIYVYNSNGKLLLTKTVSQPTEYIDISAFANGVYILRIMVGDQIKEWKIIKD